MRKIQYCFIANFNNYMLKYSNIAKDLDYNKMYFVINP